MALTQRSIFFRIYAGLLLVCLTAVALGYWFIHTINEVRIKHYRESVVSGVFYLIGEELNRRPKADQEQWLHHTSRLFGGELEFVAADSLDLKVKEIRELQNNRPVVRGVGHSDEFRVLYRTNFDERLLRLEVTQIGDRQVRALAALLVDDLAHYPTLAAKNARLEELTKRLGYPVRLADMDSLDLDGGQRARLVSGDAVLMFYDKAIAQNNSVVVVSPLPTPNRVLVTGPMALFYWAPASLLWSTAALGLIIIAMGIYVLIYPLEKRLKALQFGVNQVAAGNLETKVPVVGEDDIARLATTFNAMTAHIKRLIDSQRELTRAVSHELRTPVARIRFAIEILADEEDSEAREEQRQEIDADIEALNELIDEMLTYAKLEEGSPKLDWQLINLRELIEQVVKETKALGKPIHIQGNLPTAKTQVMADRRYLHRVLQNFAGNALRYAKSAIIISAWVDKGMAFVSVEDDGQGIPKADRDKVFIPFTRLDDSRTQATGGYGLGLSIVSRIAFWFHGSAKVDESPTLGGAKFVMSWPVRQVGITILGDEDVQAKNAAKSMDLQTIEE